MSKELSELPSIVLGVLIVLCLIIGSFMVLTPFLPALIWAATIVISSWRFFKVVERKCNGRRGWAVFCMTSLLIITFMLPLTIALVAIVENFGEATRFVHHTAANGLPQAPQIVADIPVIGVRAA